MQKNPDRPFRISYDMAHRTISDQRFLDIAIDLFRSYGFEGVSLKQLADATGLEKASLYHRYPGGKEEIVMAVAGAAAQWLQENVHQPLAASGSPRKRLLDVCQRLRVFYANGTKPCVIDVLSIRGGSSELRAALQQAMQGWIDAFARIARESGLPPTAARARAEEALTRFEGSLVVSRVLDDTDPFERALKLLPDWLTTP